MRYNFSKKKSATLGSVKSCTAAKGTLSLFAAFLNRPITMITMIMISLNISIFISI